VQAIAEFTMMHSNVIRIQAYVPQDQAFGLAPGDEAVVHVPEMPKRSFSGKVTRIADALPARNADAPHRDRRAQPR
jgi:multidrug resistance efflux pump